MTPLRIRRLVTGLGLAAAVGMMPAMLHAQEEGIKVGETAPSVTLADLDGHKVELGSYFGKRPVLLEYWATWCTVCAKLMPRVRAAHDKFGESVDFVGINVAVNQTVGRVRKYATSEKPPFTILYDAKGASARAYSAPTTSFIVIVDRHGKVAYTGVGADQPFEAALARVAE